MKQEYALIIIIILYLAVFLGMNFIDNDRKAKEGRRLYSAFKGILYAIMVLIAIIFDLIFNYQNTFTLLLTICIAIFESVQLFAQVYGEKKQERELALRKNIPPMNDYKKIEILYRFCEEQFDFIKNNGEVKDAKILAYEQVYDFFKYYACSQPFLKAFREIILTKH